MDPVPVPTQAHKGFKFHAVEDLWKALEQYGEFHDGTKCRNYGPLTPGAGAREGDEFGDTWERVMAQNKAIDHAMFRLRLVAPLQYRLLHAFYRREGPHGTPAACNEYAGWLEALRYSGLSPTKLDRVSKATFDVILDNAIGILYYAHCVRPHPRS